MLFGNLTARRIFGEYVHIVSPTFSVALPASLGGAVNRINASSRPRVDTLNDDVRRHWGRFTVILNSEYELSPRDWSIIRRINSSAVMSEAATVPENQMRHTDIAVRIER